MFEEQLLEYCWKHKLFPEEMKTEGGESIEVIDTGLYDRRNLMFFNAKIRIGGTLWVGNVKMLYRSDEWWLHSYDCDSKHQNVVLVVSREANVAVGREDGSMIHLLHMHVPERIKRNVMVLMSKEGIVRCHSCIKDYTSPLACHAWLAAMQTESLKEKSSLVSKGFLESHDWQSALEGQLFRAFGLGVNDDIMSDIYRSIPRSFLTSHHVDDLFQVEAVIFGQAGLLDLETIRENYQQNALNEGYFAELRNEWLYLAHKYAMDRPPRYEWKPYGKGRMARPHVLLSMLANLIYQRTQTVSSLLGVKDKRSLLEMVSTHATPYWQTHSEFGKVTSDSVREKKLTRDRKKRIIMDCHIPFLFAYGREMSREDTCDIAFDLMEQTQAYRTPETAWFERFGIKPDTAGDTAALCHLKNRYCDKRDCLRCRFGYGFVNKYE